MISRRVLLGSSLGAALASSASAQPLLPPDGTVRHDVLDMLRKFYDHYNSGAWEALKKDSIFETADGLQFGKIVAGSDKVIAYLKQLYAAGWRYSVSYDEFGVWVPARDLAIVTAERSTEPCKRGGFSLVDECGPEIEIHLFRFYYGDEIGSYPKISRLVVESWV